MVDIHFTDGWISFLPIKNQMKQILNHNIKQMGQTFKYLRAGGKEAETDDD